jgi:hypothetical protein
MRPKIAASPTRRPAETFVVCLPWSNPSYFTDDTRGECSACQAAVRHRPHIPRPSRLVCMDCYRAVATTGDKIGISPETMVEITLFLARAGGRA